MIIIQPISLIISSADPVMSDNKKTWNCSGCITDAITLLTNMYIQSINLIKGDLVLTLHYDWVKGQRLCRLWKITLNWTRRIFGHLFMHSNICIHWSEIYCLNYLEKLILCLWQLYKGHRYFYFMYIFGWKKKNYPCAAWESQRWGQIWLKLASIG